MTERATTISTPMMMDDDDEYYYTAITRMARYNFIFKIYILTDG